MSRGLLRGLLALLVAISVVAASSGIARAAACSSVGITVTRVSSPIFYIDTGISPQLTGMYVGYRVTNSSGVNYGDVWATIGSFTGGVVGLAPNEDGSVHVGPLASGASALVTFYLNATAATATPQTHTVTLYAARPDLAGTSLCQESFSLTVEETIKASPNQITGVTLTPNPPPLGGLLTMTVTGTTGVIGAPNIFALTPATLPTWPANAYQLVGTRVVLSGGNTGTFNDTLFLSPPNSQDTSFTITYTFRVTGLTAGPTTVSPVNYISSGQPNKHTDTDSAVYQSLPPILPAAGTTTLSKSASPATLTSGGTVTYTITLTNSGSTAVTLDDIVDVLPATPGAVTYISGSAAFNGSPIGDPSIAGQTLTFVGLFTVPAGGTATLTYRVTVPSTNGTYTNSAIGHIGAAQIDTTASTTDNAPATSSVSVGPPPTSTPTATPTTTPGAPGPTATPGAPGPTATPTATTRAPTATPRRSSSRSRSTSTPTPAPTATPTATPEPAATLTPTPTAEATVVPTATVIVQEDPFVLKVSDTGQAVLGQTVTFRLTARNPGTVPATDVVVVDRVPTTYEVLDATTSQGTVSVDGQTVTARLGTLPPGADATVTIRARVVQGVPGELVNVATLTAVLGDRPIDSTASVSVPILPSAPPAAGQGLSGAGQAAATLGLVQWLAIGLGLVGSRLRGRQVRGSGRRGRHEGAEE